jgi:hypothetical protein
MKYRHNSPFYANPAAQSSTLDTRYSNRDARCKAQDTRQEKEPSNLESGVLSLESLSIQHPVSSIQYPVPCLIFSCILIFIFLFPGLASAGDIKLINSDVNGVLLELNLADLTVESREFDDTNYHLISYDDCTFTTEVGKPRLPVSQVFLGVPPSASISVNVVDSHYSNLSGYTPFPVPEKVHRTSPGGIDMLVDEFTIDREFYRRDAFYPSGNADLIYEGNLRHQRIAVIELRPVQYNPARKILRKYSRLLVRVDFSFIQAAPARSLDQISTGNLQYRHDREFERLYKGLLLNYDDARKLRKARSSSSLAPAAQSEESEALKIFVSRPGIYKLDYSMLMGSGIDLSQVDPRTFKIRIKGNQVPIHVHGEADGRFDEEDYVEFFGAEAKEIYTRWNVYWLTWGGARGMRMVQKSGSPDARIAQEITFFKSVLRFEEDHLHHKLQNVQPDPDDLEGWFESRDHWFWAGVENGSAKNEVTVDFPIYDIAQAMVRPDFKIELVGCTNYEHNVMVSVNGYRVGNEAQWERQEIYFFDGQIPANSIQEGINQVRLARIGTSPADGQSRDSYPYQFYLNWFEIGYLRKLLAVNDSLEFSAPEPKDPDKDEINRYSVAGFLNSDIEVFQISNSTAVCKLRDVLVRSYKLDQDGRDRIKAIMRHEMEDEFAPLNIPYVAYEATFEDKGGLPARYIAVTSSSILKPDRIELDAPSDLKDPSNQADYIIIAHPMFINVAEELAEWRSGARGGGFRTRVVDVTNIYDEFGFGMVNPRAVKDFLRFAYHNWAEPAPSYVLILADAAYDFLGINEEFYEEAPELIGFIPTFYLWTTFGQTAMDHWYSTIDGDDGFPDVYLGRIPVEDVSEAQAALEKIIANESGIVNGSWRKQIISIADDDTHAAGDEIFRIGMEEIAQDYTPLGYDTQKIYLKDIAEQVAQDPLETRRPAQLVEEMIIDAFGKGAVIAQYAGHGGRHVWAHEIVFSITEIDSMKEAEIYPFLLVLSCYNGYFDLPGELSMAEGMLRANKRGSVAMLSATRLTYGTGNVSLNRFLFDGIFKDKLLRIGQVTAISKVRVLLKDGMSWLSQMEEYTLFGDPASRLNIPDHEVHPRLENATAAPGGKLRLLPGQLVNSLDGQPGAFSGNMTVKVSFPDGRESVSSVTVAGGSYPGASFDVPADMTDGQGKLTFYGENADETVVGGAKFSIGEPLLLSIEHEFIVETRHAVSLQFYVEVSDDAGPSGIKSVILNWLSPDNRSWTESSLVFDQQKKLYRLEQAIPLSFQGGDLVYYVTVEDQKGNSTGTERQTLELPSKPNLSVETRHAVSLPNASEANISYGYSAQSREWGVNAQLTSGSAEPDCPVQVFAFGNNPDQNGDMVVDDSARPIGQAEVDPEAWDDERVASAFIPLSLPIGRHTVFVWVDPELNASNTENVFGACDEVDESDNISFRILDITHILLKPGQESETRSLDNVIRFSAPAGAVSREEVISIQPVRDVQTPLNQPSVSFAPLLESQWAGYTVEHAASLFNVAGSPAGEAIRFHEPVSVLMKFDLASLKEDVKNQIGLTGIPEDQMGSEQQEALEQALREKISDVAVYLWSEAARKWVHNPSNPVQETDVLHSIHNTIPISHNAGTGIIQRTSIEVDNDVTPAGQWVLFFTGTERYQLYFRKDGEMLQRLSDKTGYVGNLYHDDGVTGAGTGIQFVVTEGDVDFQYGDVLRFTTTESFSQDGSRSVLVGSAEDDNLGDGIIGEVSLDSDTPVDEWVALFTDPQHFQLKGRTTGVAMNTGNVGEEFRDDTTGISFTIMPGQSGFAAGDRFKFRTAEVGEIQASVEASGVLTLMFNQDNRPPRIQIDVGNQNFADGDVVAPEPNIQALISDENGVDVIEHKLSIEISKDGRDFEQAGEDDYVIHWDAASNEIAVNYWPGKLEPAEYEVRFQAYDFNGNSNTGPVKFIVKREFELGKDSLMNYPNPFERETDVTFHLTSVADEAIVKIYTVSGRLIRTLNQQHAVNFVVIRWDGRDEDGSEVANGAYYYKVRLKREGRKDIVEIGKMMKLK